MIQVRRPKQSKNPLWLLRAARAIRATRPDIIHTHRPNLIRFCLLSSALFSASSTPCQQEDRPESAGSRLSSFKGFPLRPLRLCGESLLVTTVHTTGVPVEDLRTYDKVFAVSNHVARDLENRAPHLKPIVIPNGIDFSLIPAAPPAPAPAPDAPFRIVQIARLDHTIKGQDILLKALALLNDPQFVSRFSPNSDLRPPISQGFPPTSELRSPTSQGFPPISDLRPPTSLDLIGEGPSAPYLRRLASELGISDQVAFRGQLPRKKVYELLPTYSLLACPSRREGFGLTVIEAMAAGIPVLVPNEGAPSEIVRSAFSDLRSPNSDLPASGAFTFEPDNPSSCADTLLRILSVPPSQVHLQAARDYAVKHFDIDSAAMKAVAPGYSFGRLASRVLRRNTSDSACD